MRPNVDGVTPVRNALPVQREPPGASAVAPPRSDAAAGIRRFNAASGGGRADKVRLRVATAICRLIECFGFASCKARDMRHLTSQLVRRLVAANLVIA